MKPIIGIIARPGQSEAGHDTMLAYKKVSDAVIKYGGIPLAVIPPVIDEFYKHTIGDTKKLTEKEINDYLVILSLCDGIICQGGDDFYDYDIVAIKYAYEHDIPLLGICLGMQTMAYVFDGNVEDIGHLSHQKPTEKYVDTITLKETSLLKKIYGENIIFVNSRHKSHVTKTNLEVVGYSSDGIIEAIEDSSKKFFIGVQWHPESMVEYDILTSRLFTYFIGMCK